MDTCDIKGHVIMATIGLCENKYKSHKGRVSSLMRAGNPEKLVHTNMLRQQMRDLKKAIKTLRSICF